MRKIKTKEKLNYTRKIRRIQKGFLHECITDQDSMSMIIEYINTHFKKKLSTEFRNKILYDIIYPLLYKKQIAGFGYDKEYYIFPIEGKPDEIIQYIYQKLKNPNIDLQFGVITFTTPNKRNDFIKNHGRD